MLGNTSCKAGFRGGRLRGLINKLAVMSVASTLLFTTGCPGMGNILCSIPILNLFIPDCRAPECETDADCEGNANGEVCDTEAGECVECLTDADCDQGVCSEAAGNVCVECIADADCDDGDPCTDDTCANATCSNDPVECPDGQICDPDTGDCVDVCMDDADCDDGDACTTDTCNDDGTCSNDAVDCGDQICDPADGSCVDCLEDADCGDGEVCDMGVCVPDVCESDEDCPEDLPICDVDTGMCVECLEDADCDTGFNCEDNACVEGGPCETDADCDDGLFCNGVETCDADAGTCVDGEDPCADTVCVCQGEEQDPICDEGDDAAECSCPECPGIEFTLSQDNLSGSTGDDVFEAPLIFAEGAGAQRDSLQTGDSANGLAGTDTLNATLTQGGNPVLTLMGIENINVTNFAAETLNGSNITGATNFGWIGGTANLTINTLAGKANGTIDGIATAGNTFSLVFQAGASTSPTTATDDMISLDVSNTTTGTFDFTTAANGFETLEVNSTGGNANTLTAITQTTGTSLATINFTGDTDLELLTVPGTARTIDGSSMSGGLTLGNGTEDTTYAEFSNPTSNWIQITTGSGDDLLIFEDTLTTNDFTGTGTIDTGDGTDAVQSTFGASFSAASKLRNVEEPRFNITADATYNFSGATGLEMITIEEDGSAETFTLTNVPVSSTANTWPTLNFRGDMGTGASQTFDDVTYTATGNTGSADVLNVMVHNRGTALNTGTSSTNVMNIGDTELTAAGFETINIDVADGPATFNGITASTLITLDIDAPTSNTGTNVTLGTVQATSTTIQTVDASEVTGAFNATLDFLVSGATITTGDGNDSVTIGTNSAANHSVNANLGDGTNTYVGDTSTGGTDTVTTGSGNDSITPGPGADTVTTGSGTDTVNMDNSDTDEAIQDTVTDFQAGTGGDIIQFDFSSLEAIDSAVAGNVGDITDANNASIAGGEAFTIQLVTADGGACTADLCLFDDDLAASVNANMAALLVDVAAGTITIDCADDFDQDDAFLVGYSDGSGNVRIGILVGAANDEANTDNVVEGADVLILSGVDVDDLVNGNFAIWQ